MSFNRWIYSILLILAQPMWTSSSDALKNVVNICHACLIPPLSCLPFTDLCGQVCPLWGLGRGHLEVLNSLYFCGRCGARSTEHQNGSNILLEFLPQLLNNYQSGDPCPEKLYAQCKFPAHLRRMDLTPKLQRHLEKFWVSTICYSYP